MLITKDIGSYFAYYLLNIFFFVRYLWVFKIFVHTLDTGCFESVLCKLSAVIWCLETIGFLDGVMCVNWIGKIQVSVEQTIMFIEVLLDNRL